ncbi:hypothetical protein LCGC14_2296070 [marine sediment metagenome]|uniref:Uncharacterized protein n=1 Tax=marine sediment metagenome TaxID=412755 RepID=A0A0F9FJZ6_9ZZZZ
MKGGSRRSGGGGTLYARYRASATGQTGMGANCRAMLAAGPDGPVTSVRFENVREGIANAEAVIFIQKALLSGKMPVAEAGKYRQLLDERVNAARVYSLGLGQTRWQDRDRRLYQAAAEIAGQPAR